MIGQSSMLFSCLVLWYIIFHSIPLFWLFGSRVNHSKNAIVKPQGPSAQETQREVDEAMKKVKEATLAISASIIPDTPKSKRSPSRSRSRSR